ncbi:TadE/TadG family type IV pilus assembly protein [Microbacterium bovistercoris]|uniref:TadE/TadG family type IV pilus assembly protein n=1 Tax=Microbacterium bovistercoris TaxID=2293570 RepID=UPI0015F2672B|nr:TadE/TadG family type IV pilus assembly protein [Microbacterium bovistercoris]
MSKRFRDERGATAVLVGILLVPLLGIAALAIDVGALYAERAQLQNGVDGAALAIAAQCAKDESACGADATSVAEDYVDANASVAWGELADEVTLTALPDISENTVTVTAKRNVHHLLAGVLPGVEGNGEEVYASGSAEWGVPVAGGVLPIGFGVCEFEDAVLSEPGDTENRVTIEFGVKDREGCEPTDNPGGFGWLDAAACEVEINFEGPDSELWLGGNDGAGGGDSGCGNADAFLRKKLHTVMLIPVFDHYKGIKANAACSATTPDDGPKHCYHVSRFAAFYLTGGKLGSFTEKDPYADASDPADGKANGYLQGNFVKYVAVDDLDFTLGDGDEESATVKVVRLIITDDELSRLTT